LENGYDLSFTEEQSLKDLAEKLGEAYPQKADESMAESQEISPVKKLAQDIDEMIHSFGPEGYAETVVDANAFISKLALALEQGDDKLGHIKKALDYAAAFDHPGAAKLSRRLEAQLSKVAQEKTAAPKTLAEQMRDAEKQVKAQDAQKHDISRDKREER
jgi:hypothetical protein